MLDRSFRMERPPACSTARGCVIMVLGMNLPSRAPQRQRPRSHGRPIRNLLNYWLCHIKSRSNFKRATEIHEFEVLLGGSEPSCDSVIAYSIIIEPATSAAASPIYAIREDPAAVFSLADASSDDEVAVPEAVAPVAPVLLELDVTVAVLPSDEVDVDVVLALAPLTSPAVSVTDNHTTSSADKMVLAVVLLAGGAVG